MGNPQANQEQHQEYDIQPQEYQDETSVETTYQEQQPPPRPQYPPPQANAGYGPQPAQPARFHPGGGYMNSKSSYQPPQGPKAPPSQPAPYPSHNPNQPAAYPPQPAQFPPVSPQMNPAYSSGPNQPAAYPPQHMPAQPMHGQVQPQAFRGQANFNQNAYQAPQPQAVSFPPQASSPYNPAVQPQVGIPMQQQYSEGWRTGLFDCMDDPMNALTTACFPCITFGQIAEIIDNGHTSCGTSGLLYGLVLGFIGLPCIFSCGYRTKLRAKYGLVEAPAPDWITHFFCEWCALCQEYRELQRRGLDPAIGWQGNMNMQQQPPMAMTPPMGQKMMS